MGWRLTHDSACLTFWNKGPWTTTRQNKEASANTTVVIFGLFDLRPLGFNDQSQHSFDVCQAFPAATSRSCPMQTIAVSPLSRGSSQLKLKSTPESSRCTHWVSPMTSWDFDNARTCSQQQINQTSPTYLFAKVCWGRWWHQRQNESQHHTRCCGFDRRSMRKWSWRGLTQEFR